MVKSQKHVTVDLSGSVKVVHKDAATRMVVIETAEGVQVNTSYEGLTAFLRGDHDDYKKVACRPHKPSK
jgi:N6-adenosine-specific RNA methylase IME4